MTSARSSAETWELLETTLELGDGLDYLLLECASPRVGESVAWALEGLATRVGRPFRAPPAGGDVLTWLERERAAAAGDAALRDAHPIYLVPVPADNEGFVLARLNENRDNLANDMRGALCLLGLAGFLDRLPAGAPSIWAFRTKTFSFADPPPGASAPRSEPPHVAPRGGNEALEVLGGGALGPRHDVYISAAYRDEPIAEDLRRRLEADGIRCSFVKEAEQDRRAGLEGIAAQAEQARFIVPLLSPDYGESNAWKALEGSREMAEAPERLRARMLPVLVRSCVPPPFLSGFEPIDFRSPRDRLFGYPLLAAAINGWSQDERPSPRKPFEPWPLDVAFLSTGVERARSVVHVRALLEDRSRPSICSGFLIARDLLLTAHHALFNKEGAPAPDVEVWAGYEEDLSHRLRGPIIVRGRPETIIGDAAHGWAVLRLDLPAGLEMAPLDLHPTRPPRVEDPVILVHHPWGLPKQVSLWGNVRAVDDNVFRYAPRLSGPGSAGGPVFNKRWEVVGLTHRWIKIDDPTDPFNAHSVAIRIEPIADALRARGLLP